MIEINNHEHGLLITRAAQTLYDVHHDVVISRTIDGRLAGGVVYYDFTFKSIAMHIAGFHTHWINRDLAWMVFHYAFKQLGVTSIFCEIRSGYNDVIDLAHRFGFIYECTIPEVFPVDDLVILRMRAENCKWLNYQPKEITFGGNDGR